MAPNAGGGGRGEEGEAADGEAGAAQQGQRDVGEEPHVPLGRSHQVGAIRASRTYDVCSWGLLKKETCIIIFFLVEFCDCKLGGCKQMRTRDSKADF